MSTSTVTALPHLMQKWLAMAGESLIERLCRSLARNKDFLFCQQTGPAPFSMKFKTPSDRLGQLPEKLVRLCRLIRTWLMAADIASGAMRRSVRCRRVDAHLQPHQPYFQSLKYNHLNGGIARHYEPIAAEVLAGATMQSLIRLGCELFGRLAFLPVAHRSSPISHRGTGGRFWSPRHRKAFIRMA